jgi:hypothetical protein
LQASDIEPGALVDYHAIHRGNVNDRQQTHGVAYDVWACPMVAGGEGRHRWHGCFVLGHVDEMVELKAPLGAKCSERQPT